MKYAMFSLLMGFSILLSFAQKPVIGDWEGTLTLQGTQLGVVFHIVEEGEGLTATMDSPNQGAYGIPTDEARFVDGVLTISARQLRMTYTGTLAEGKLSGTFEQNGSPYPLELSPKSKPAAEVHSGAYPKEIIGDWNGTLEIQGQKLRLVFHVSETESGLVSTMDSPDQGAFGMPADETKYEDNTLIIKANQIGMTFSGQVEDGKLTGKFKQGPMNLPLELVREEQPEPEQEKRPQDPQEPYPYEEEEVHFPNEEAGGIKLAGTLTRPRGVENPPAVVLISGSGPQNRDEELFNHRPFKVLADHLTRQGIAVLRYDDRGVAESEGDFEAATSADFATDAYAAMKFLRSQPDMEQSPIGLVGHSEGGMIAPIVASEYEDVDFIVLLAGPGIPIPELLADQTKLLSDVQGVPTELTERNIAALSKTYKVLSDNPDLDETEIRAALEKTLTEELKRYPDFVKEGIEDMDGFMKQQIDPLLTPWFRYFIGFEPANFLRKVSCPVLAVNGSLDLQVPAQSNLAGIEKALAEGGNKNVMTREFDGLNHLFQPTETGNPQEYGEIETTLAPEMMETVSAWILKVVE